jgi:hypothetical protein
VTGNTDFTVGLGCYDEVFTYDELDSLPADAPHMGYPRCCR